MSQSRDGAAHFCFFNLKTNPPKFQTARWRVHLLCSFFFYVFSVANGKKLGFKKSLNLWVHKASKQTHTACLYSFMHYIFTHSLTHTRFYWIPPPPSQSKTRWTQKNRNFGGMDTKPGFTDTKEGDLLKCNTAAGSFWKRRMGKKKENRKVLCGDQLFLLPED